MTPAEVYRRVLSQMADIEQRYPAEQYQHAENRWRALCEWITARCFEESPTPHD